MSKIMPAPESLGPYRILSTIGRGGMGTVYAAIDGQSGERVAVKLIAHQMSDDTRFRDRFTSEIKSLARLRHPGIVRFMHSYIDEEGQIFYSMELVEGESLQALIRRENKLGWDRTIEFAIQITSALKHAHDAGVIHRDLKPANLMLTNDGTVKLVDFGIAKLFGDSQQTNVGALLGTADYMAPEQATNTNITPRTDLYALGNVMYAMLVGRPPFVGKQATAVIDALNNDSIPPLDLIDPHLPAELVELVHHLLEKDPKKRPPTALVVMKRLQSMQVGLRRRDELEPDEIPTQIPQRDSCGDTSSKASPRDPANQTDELRDKQKQEGTDASNVDISRPTSVTEISRGEDKTLVPGESAADDVIRRHSAVTDFHLNEASEQEARNDGMAVTDAGGWQHWFTIFVMVMILGGGAGLFWYAMQPPSANTLYRQARTGDLSAMNSFMRRFPDDPRYAEIETQQRESRVAATLKRLNTQIAIGTKTLTAAEEGFVAALNQRANDPEQAGKKIGQWLNIYEGATAGDERLLELVELAKFARQQLGETTESSGIDPRASELIVDIDRIVREKSPEEIRTRLQGIIETFAGKPWAEPAIERANQELRQLSPE
ncbi:MAG: serine/threonine protein kinase [Planctomycetaceae bacterium]|nr:serine/threonine protein kinase [Planctomycetaceae bacterium]